VVLESARPYLFSAATNLRQYYAEESKTVAATIAAQRRRVQFAFTALILLFTLALIALLKCKREDIPEVIRALAFWWKGGWPRS
jgi:RNase P/RNase MRP subunit POP5